MSETGRVVRPLLVLTGGVLALVAVSAIHVGQGSSEVGFGDVVDTVTGTAASGVRDVVLGSRVPRLLAGLVAGAALAIAGALLQAVTRNPLAAPDTLAVNAGAYLATVVAVVTGGGLGVLPNGGIAFVGGLIAAGLVYLLAAGVGMTPTRLLLAGMAVTLCLTSATAVLLLLFEQRTGGMFLWGQGNLVQTSGERPLMMLPVVVLVAGVVIAFARALDVLGAGDDTARALGVPVGWVRLAAVLLAVLVASAAVVVCGPIGFVGLAAPHLVRLSGVVRHRMLIPATAVWGATLLLGADVLARIIGQSGSGGSELPAGIVTALAGAPFFLWLARRIRAGAGTASAHASGTPTSRLPYPLALGIAVALLGIAVLGALKFGEQPIAWRDVFATLTGGLSGGGDSGSMAIVAELRAPRVAIAVITGAALAASGVILQAVVRNPLAEPALLGVTGGAGVGGLLVLFLVPSMVVLLPVGAFLGAAAAFGLAYVLAWQRGVLPERLVLVGVGVSALTAALVSYLVVGRLIQIAEALTWLSGSIYARGWDDVALVLWVPCVLLPLAWLFGRQLDAIALGDDPPRSLGIRLEPARLGLLTLAVALAAGSVAVVGTIGFVGLVAPHAARSFVAGRHRRLLVVAALLGALLVLVADTVGRTLLAPTQIPAGLVTALIGTPYFGWRLWRTRNQRL